MDDSQEKNREGNVPHWENTHASIGPRHYIAGIRCSEHHMNVERMLHI